MSAIGLIRGPVIEGVSFASRPGSIFVPVREAADDLGWTLQYDPLVELIQLRGKTLDPAAPRLSDGSWLISLRDLSSLGASVAGVDVADGSKGFQVRLGPKRVLVDITHQRLRAWQGARLVYDWPVSSGRERQDTPDGEFVAHEKEPMHISKLYGSPMPFSIHVTGNIYIHGSTAFSDSPGSHGCIRLPLMESRNIAEEFFNWIDSGTPIRIVGRFDFRGAMSPARVVGLRDAVRRPDSMHK